METDAVPNLDWEPSAIVNRGSDWFLPTQQAWPALPRLAFIPHP